MVGTSIAPHARAGTGTPSQQLAAAMKSVRKSRFQVSAPEHRTVDDIVFDSKREAARYVELKRRQEMGFISHLTLQPEYRVEIDGKPYCRFTADFGYFEGGQSVVEDVKSSGTAKDAAYRLRKKAAELFFKIKVVEVLK